MSIWYLLYDEEPKDSSENMAIDEFFFNKLHNIKSGILRIYFWKNPTFSYGVSQKYEKAINLEFIRNNKNLSYVRRITGGKTVLHNDEITYSVISSEDIFYKNNDLYKSYKLISDVLVKALNNVGIEAYLSKGSKPILSKSNNPCFSFPTPNEIEVNDKKIVGSAQKRDKYALLQHGSIPFSMDYNLYANGANSRPSIISRSMTTIKEIKDISKQELSMLIIDEFRKFIKTDFKNYEFDNKDLSEINELKKKYSSDSWNFII